MVGLLDAHYFLKGRDRSRWFDWNYMSVALVFRFDYYSISLDVWIFFNIWRQTLDESWCLKCDSNTTLETLGVRVPPKYWRDSLNTSVLYFCDGRNSERCIGNGNSTRVASRIEEDYCADGYHGSTLQTVRR